MKADSLTAKPGMRILGQGNDLLRKFLREKPVGEEENRAARAQIQTSRLSPGRALGHAVYDPDGLASGGERAVMPSTVSFSQLTG